MKERTPYTYVITHLLTGKRYYGVSFGVGCHPDKLGVTYFSSSKVMRELFVLHPLEQFAFEVRRVFDTSIEAQRWETTVLRRLDVRHNEMWLNASNNADGFYCKEYLTHEHRAKIGAAHKGKVVPAESRLKMSKSQTGKKQSPEQIAKRVAKNLGKTRSESAIALTAEKNRGRKNTPEAIELMRANRKGIGLGRKHTPEQIAKRVASRLRNKQLLVDGQGSRGTDFP